MAHLLPGATASLSYPLYACDFDPQDDTRIVVGGGGGPGRSGVGNKITVFDASLPGTLEQIAELDLSKSEDSVMSLALGSGTGRRNAMGGNKTDATTTIYAGVNSSVETVKAGRNEHLRVFELTSRKAGKEHSLEKKCQLAEQSRTTLFTTREPDAYQRIVRLSKPFRDSPQLGVVATGLAKQSEIVLFDTIATPPTSLGQIEINVETNDVDVLQTGQTDFVLAYCTDHEIYAKTISPETSADAPACAYMMPEAEEQGDRSARLPSFRALRWLTPNFVCVLTNINSQSAVSLQIFRMPAESGQRARISQLIRLPRHVTKATALATVLLTPPSTPSEPQGATQIVVAVAGHDSSISLYKVDLQVSNGLYYPGNFKHFRTVRSVHALQITSLAFSNFQPPQTVTTTTPQQMLRLASTSMGNSLVVHSIPLFPLPFEVSTGRSKRPRYVVALPSKSLVTGVGFMGTVLFVAFLAFFIQTVLELRGTTPNWVNAHDWTPSFLQNALQSKQLNWPSEVKTPRVADHVITSDQSHILEEGMDDLAQKQPDVAIQQKALFDHLRAEGDEHKMVLIEEDVGEHETNPELTAGSRMKAMLVDHEDQHDDTAPAEGAIPRKPRTGKTWEELTHYEKHSWKQKLTDAGHWIEEMPETVFKGVLFGELGGLVGQMVGGM